MTTLLKPVPDGEQRGDRAAEKRALATQDSRGSLPTTANGEFDLFDGVWPTHFTKGLPHSADGMVDPEAFHLFVQALNEGDPEFNVPLGPADAKGSYRPAGYSESANMQRTFHSAGIEVRGWESPVAGHIYDLEGPDAGSVGMAPAPRLGSDELAAEMAENYAMALLRDIDFETIRAGDLDEVRQVVESLSCMPWFDQSMTPADADESGPDSAAISPQAQRRRRARFSHGETTVSRNSLFRGSSFGCMDGPYLSQFLLLGNESLAAPDVEDYVDKKEYSKTSKGYTTPLTSTRGRTGMIDGYIQYGTQNIDQRLVAHKEGVDHMTDWPSWLDVQNGANTTRTDVYRSDEPRFLTTPRDLATYVHFDALYQAYLNACLILLGIQAKADSGLPEENAHKTRTPFASFGGPHVLTLVTESATRSLKAVRRQKYNHHLRARPEAIGALAALAKTDRASSLCQAEAYARAHVDKLEAAVDGSGSSLMAAVARHNNDRSVESKSDGNLPDISSANYLLPMAFPEGSPMHPAYGAGHATVAGSCVTMLKAFFETFRIDESGAETWEPLPLNEVGKDNPIQRIVVPEANGSALRESTLDSAGELTLLGELNKLAANISIGRNMAGVHFYSDYFDSLRMGERIAVGMLKEQMHTYPESVRMRLLSFDDDRITIAVDDSGTVTLQIDDCHGAAVDEDDWFARHV